MNLFMWFFVGLTLVGLISLSGYFWRNRTIRATECGHSTKIQGQITALGETVQMSLPVKMNRTGYCHTCLGRMTIQCAWCNAPIFIGDEVSLYIADKEQSLPEGAREYFHEGRVRSFVGCVGCADLGPFDAQGIWMPPGVVERMPSATEQALVAFRQGAQAAVFHR